MTYMRNGICDYCLLYLGVYVLQDSVQKASGQLSELETQLINISPISRDEAKLRMQERQTEVSEKNFSILYVENIQSFW